MDQVQNIQNAIRATTIQNAGDLERLFCLALLQEGPSEIQKVLTVYLNERDSEMKAGGIDAYTTALVDRLAEESVKKAGALVPDRIMASYRRFKRNKEQVLRDLKTDMIQDEEGNWMTGDEYHSFYA
jgi:hypothetical protein